MSSLLSLNKTYSVVGAIHASYPDTGGIEATDGLVGNGSGYGGANAFLATDATIAITINLLQTYVLDYARFHYEVWGAGSADACNSVLIEGSNNGSSFTTIATYTKAGGYWVDTDGAHWSNSLTLGNVQYGYVRFTFTRASSYHAYSEIEIYGSPINTINHFWWG